MSTSSEFVLRLTSGPTLQLKDGTTLRAGDLVNFKTALVDGTFAEVSRNPNDPTVLGLKNLSQHTWTVTLADGSSRQVEPGRNIKLANGTTINFDPVSGTVRETPGGFSFALSPGFAVPLRVGQKVTTSVLFGLQGHGSIAEISRNPNDPTILGLKNLTSHTWTVVVADGSQHDIVPGKSIKLAAGTTIDFGPIKGVISLFGGYGTTGLRILSRIISTKNMLWGIGLLALVLAGVFTIQFLGEQSELSSSSVPVQRAIKNIIVRETINSAEGGILAVSKTGSDLDGVLLKVPPGAVASAASVDITVSLVASPPPFDVMLATGSDTELVAVGPTVNLEPSGLTFVQPVELTLPFHLSQLPSGTDPRDLAVAVVSVDQNGQRLWELVENSRVDLGAGTITILSQHFSTKTAVTQNKKKGDLGESRMNEFAAAPKTEGGLGMQTIFNPKDSKIARGGGAGGNGFDGVFRDGDRLVIGESKFGSSRLGEFDIYDDEGKETGIKGKFLQGSKEWVENVLRRMRGGSDHDRQVAEEVGRALREGKLDFLLFKVRNGNAGAWEVGPVEPGATTPRKSYGGKAGSWKRKKGKLPAIEKMKFGEVGCSSPCRLGSRFYEEAAKRRMSDPRYVDLDKNHPNVNPNYIIPGKEVLDDNFQQDRIKALTGSEKLKVALPSTDQELIQKKMSAKGGAHFGREKAKSQIDRQRFWKKLPGDSKLKIQRTRSLVDAFKADERSLKILQGVMAAGALAQLSWSYYEGGEEALLYAIGQMVEEAIQGFPQGLAEDLKKDLAIYAVQKAALSSNAWVSAAAKKVLPLVESGALVTVPLIIDTAQAGYQAGYWFTTTYILGEEYDAKARQISTYFLKDVSVEKASGLTAVNFATLCDSRFFPTKKSLTERLNRPQNYTLLADVWEKAKTGLEQSWLECRNREIVEKFFASRSYTLENFCEKLTIPETFIAGLGQASSELGGLDQEDWQVVAQNGAVLYERCKKSWEARLALSESQEPIIPPDLEELEQEPSTEPEATAFLLVNTETEETISKTDGEVEIITKAALWGLPGTGSTVRLVSYLEDAQGQRQQLKEERQTFQFDEEAYEPEELTQLVTLDDKVTTNGQASEESLTYLVELYLGTNLIETRRVKIESKSQEDRYYIYAVNTSGWSLYVGRPSDVEGRSSSSFTDGGTGDQPVEFKRLVDLPFDSREKAIDYIKAGVSKGHQSVWTGTWVKFGGEEYRTVHVGEVGG